MGGYVCCILYICTYILMFHMRLKSMYDEIESSLPRRDVDSLKEIRVAEGVAERCHEIS